MRVLGIDPGLRTTGYAIIDVNGDDLQLLAGGCIETISGKRLRQIYEVLLQVVKDFEPSCAVVESTFVNINPRTSLALGQARGVCLLSLEVSDIMYTEISTSVIRKKLVNKGNASKKEVHQLIENTFNIFMSHHISDAIASVISIFMY